MQATAISSIKSRNKSKKDKNPKGEADTEVQTTQEHKKISKWPAKILAPSRNPKVKGWIHNLTSSIKIIRGINKGGVPCGTKCATFLFHFLIMPITFKVNQIGRDILKVNLRWEV